MAEKKTKTPAAEKQPQAPKKEAKGKQEKKAPAQEHKQIKIKNGSLELNLLVIIVHFFKINL